MKKYLLQAFFFLCFMFVYTVLLCSLIYEEYEISDTCPNCGASEYRIERYEKTNMRQYPKRKKVYGSKMSSQYLAGNQTIYSLPRSDRTGHDATTNIKLINGK